MRMLKLLMMLVLLSACESLNKAQEHSGKNNLTGSAPSPAPVAAMPPAPSIPKPTYHPPAPTISGTEISDSAISAGMSGSSVKHAHAKASKKTVKVAAVEQPVPPDNKRPAPHPINMSDAPQDTGNPSTAKPPTVTTTSFTAKVRADALMYIGESSKFTVWIGRTGKEPATETSQISSQKEFPVKSNQLSAKAIPITPGFQSAVVGSDCTALMEDGSEVAFNLTPEKLGTFRISANVALYASTDCSGLAQSIVVQDKSISVHVDWNNVTINSLWTIASHLGSDISNLIFGIFAAICGALLLASKKKIYAFFARKTRQ